MNDLPQIPEFISPASIMEMSDEQVDQLLDSIRKRRLVAVQLHEETQRVAAEKAEDRARVDLLKQCELLSNDIQRVDKHLEKMETRVTKIRVLRLQLGVDE